MLTLAGVGVGVAPELSSKKAVQSEGGCMGGARAAVSPVGRHHCIEGVTAESGGAGGSVAESGEPAGAVGVNECAKGQEGAGPESRDRRGRGRGQVRRG